jgi:ribosomal protein S18 acetylase RimI-like enzyme
LAPEISQQDLLARAVETDRIYFELGAALGQLPGATLAWMPGLTRSAAAAVIHRVDPTVVAELGDGWIRQAEQVLHQAEAGLARVYLDARHAGADEVLRRAGYVDRDELVFVHSLPAPPADLQLRPVETAADWIDKARFHETIDETPDGHANGAADWVELERRKCAEGMDAFLAELDGTTVGAIGAIWGDGILRMKNVVVHPAHRRRSVGLGMLSLVAALGRARGISQVCVMAVRGDAGELLYRSAGMQMVGTQVEWSKQIGEVAA